MRTSLLALLLALLALAPGGLGLTLLETPDEAGEEQVHLRVDQSPLQARLVDGEVRLDQAEVGAELAPLAVETSPWRGFHNVTTLALEGNGSLLLTDGASALLLAVDADPPDASSGTSDHGPEQEAREATEQETRSLEEASDEPGTEGPEPSLEEPASSSATRSQASTGGGDDEGGLPADPAVVGLSLTAAGAFLVEVFSRSRLREA